MVVHVAEPDVLAPAPAASNPFGLDPIRLDKVKGAFLASLNHEFRTPLSGVIGMLDLLSETSLDADQQEYLSAARLCAESLTEHLNASLEYAALEAGEFSLDESEFSLKETLEAAIAQQQPKADAKGLKLSLHGYANLPETMIGDAGRIRELIVRLISNAVKFTHTGSIQVRALLTGSRDSGEHLVVAVSDTGIGIPPEKIDRIFDTFHQVEEGLSRNYAGLGLGLALVRKLTTAMGGSIQVESTLEEGSTFTVEIPISRPPEIVAPDREAAREEEEDQLAAPLILAVEDNAVGMRVLRSVLQRHHVRVVSATSGEAAIEAAQNNQLDLILMDLQMPGIDGLEAATAIRKLPGYESVPILALTANCSDQVREQCLRHGMQAYLSKPINAQELWSAISRYLR
jgi:CheY-like chemotaxis protein